MFRYGLGEQQFQRALSRAGYASTAQFAREHRINRATLNNYLQGRGPLPEAFYAIADALHADPLQLLIPTTSVGDIPKLEEIAPIITAVSAASSQIAVGLLGSRAHGAAKTYSDWDLGVTSGLHPLSDKDFFRLKQMVNDLADDLPRGVDLMNLDAAPDWFLKGIQYTPKLLAGNELSWSYFMGVLHGVHKASE